MILRMLQQSDLLHRMFMFGLSQPIDICYIKGCACRPIVTCTPNAVHFGQIKVLNRAQRTITLNNDSPVKVFFRACVVMKTITFLLALDAHLQKMSFYMHAASYVQVCL